MKKSKTPLGYREITIKIKIFEDDLDQIKHICQNSKNHIKNINTFLSLAIADKLAKYDDDCFRYHNYGSSVVAEDHEITCGD